MSAKRFVAADMRRALELVREQLGPDAIILSNRRVKEGVELICSLESEPQLPAGQQSLASDGQGVPEQAPLTSDGAWAEKSDTGRFEAVSEPKVEAFSGAFKKSGAAMAADIERAREKMLAAQAQPIGMSQSSPANAQPITPAQERQLPSFSAASEDSAVQDRQLSEMKSELADLRELLELQLGQGAAAAKPSSGIDAHLQPLLARFERLALPLSLSSQVLSELTGTEKTAREIWPDALAALAHKIPVAGEDVVDGGGVFAFVGPTGVGKTTTIGKLAARYVLKHGASDVVLITTDTYRIAAHDQLKTLGRILNIDVKVVENTHSLPSVLAGVSNKALVLIDTAGFRHGDPLLKEQLQALGSNLAIKKMLVLSCNSQLQMLKASVHAYKKSGISGVVLTKLDESASLGEAVGLMAEANLPVVYTTDGQEIPKDIQVAQAHQLVSRAVNLAKQVNYTDAGTA